MKKLLVASLFLSLAFAFTLPEGRYELSEQGVNYGLYVPARLGDKMILVLPDVGMTGKQCLEFWYEYAKQSNVLVLAPDALNDDVWQKDDEERIMRILNIISRDYGKMKILIQGISTSSHYALYLAINNSERFDALCNFTGLVVNSLSSEIVQNFEGQTKIPFLFVHGMLDEEISKKHARWDVQKMREKGYEITYWEINNSKKEQAYKDIIAWFETAISQ